MSNRVINTNQDHRGVTSSQQNAYNMPLRVDSASKSPSAAEAYGNTPLNERRCSHGTSD